jgi:RNA polymerase-interacting CarD/CdnL/TRCF family regulator
VLRDYIKHEEIKRLRKRIKEDRSLHRLKNEQAQDAEQEHVDLHQVIEKSPVTQYADVVKELCLNIQDSSASPKRVTSFSKLFYA